MSMGYVPVDQSVTNHKKTLRLSRLLGENRYTVVGRLVALWNWAADSVLDGVLNDMLLDVDSDMLADVCGWDERCGLAASHEDGRRLSLAVVSMRAKLV